MPRAKLTEAEFEALVDHLRQQAQLPPLVRLPVYLTKEELAEYLHMSVGQLANWRSKGIGPPYVRGESTGDKALILYPLAEVQAWLKSRLVVPLSA